jgi:branched-chain amino acid transport system substrate-binding protein
MILRALGGAVPAILIAAASVCMGLSLPASAQDKTQFMPIVGYRVGQFASVGSGFYGGMIDYFTMINERDGGVNGVKLTWEECETEYNNARGVECYERLKGKGPTGGTMVQPMSTGIVYSILERATNDKIPLVTIGYGRTDTSDGRVFPYAFPMITNYWSQTTAIIKFMGQRSGGMDKLKGKRIAHVYHDSAFGKEPIPLLQDLAQKYGFELILVPVTPPGLEQQAAWLRVRQEKADFALLWAAGIMAPTAIKTAYKVGFPRDRLIGIWWSGSEEDVIPAADAAKGYIAAGYTVSGANYPIVQEVVKYVYKKGKGNLEDKSRIGFVYYNRGLVGGLVAVEAVRKAQEKFGKGKPVTGEQVRWALEHMTLDNARLKQLGAEGFMPPTTITCADHEGSGMVKFQQWDGTKWKSITDWIAPEKELVRAKIEASAMAYAKEKGITPRDCSKEN